MLDALQSLALAVGQLAALGCGIALCLALLFWALDGWQERRKDRQSFDVDSAMLRRFRASHAGIVKRRLGEKG